MKAYVARDQSGKITRGWLLRKGTSIGSAVCRFPQTSAQDVVEEVTIDVAVRGAAKEGTQRAGSKRVMRGRLGAATGQAEASA